MSAIAKAARSGVVLFAGLTGGFAQPALAQDVAPPVEAPVEDGKIIYSRDVHHSIGAQHFPGETDAAVTAPTKAIIDTVALGLAPLTDSEGAAITASMPAVLAALGPTPLQQAGGQNALGGGLGQFIVTETSSGSAGSAINSAMGALSGALESLSVISGGRP